MNAVAFNPYALAFMAVFVGLMIVYPLIATWRKRTWSTTKPVA